MKNKFKALMAYFRAFKKDELDFELDIEDETYVYDFNISSLSRTQWPLHHQSFPITKTMGNIFVEISEEYGNDFWDEGPGSRDVDAWQYYRVVGRIKPFENKIIYDRALFTYRGYENTGDQYEFEQYVKGERMYEEFLKVRELLKKSKRNSFYVEYNGSGDSGWIELPPGYPSELEDISYYLLERYGGWEINEGSQGNIEFTKDYITVDHEWNTEEDGVETLDIIIDEESFK